MSEPRNPDVGTIAWTDLTVDEAEDIKRFYSEVVGWKPIPVDMGGYSDFNMTSPDTGTPAAGICHARGANVGLPRQWLIYVVVADLDASVARCTELGGRIVVDPKPLGAEGRYCVIEDPAGAVAALYQPA